MFIYMWIQYVYFTLRLQTFKRESAKTSSQPSITKYLPWICQINIMAFTLENIQKPWYILVLCVDFSTPDCLQLFKCATDISVSFSSIIH